MRWLKRSLLFWAISLPLFYLFGLPALLDYTSAKVRRDYYAQCIAHLTSDGMLGSANAALTQAQGETYCHCVSDPLTFTQNDLWDAAHKQEPAALTAMAQSLAERCNDALRATQGFGKTAPAEDVIYIN